MRFSDIEPGKHALTEAPIREPALVVDPDKEMDRKEIYAILHKAKETLGPTLEKVLDLYADGETYKSIGDQLGVSPSRARQLVRRALLTLQGRLNMSVKGDAGHMYGYKKTDVGRTYRGSHGSPAYLYKSMQGNPNLKIVALDGSGYRFTVVQRDDPRPEVIHDPDHDKKLQDMNRELEDKTRARQQLDSAAYRLDRERPNQNYQWYHRDQLRREPAYQQLQRDITRLDQQIHDLKKRGNWYFKNEVSEEVWDNPNPKKKHKKLSPEKKAAAKARAKRAGRPYPNLIDNMWASKK